jgi:hypothetical protein
MQELPNEDQFAQIQQATFNIDNLITILLCFTENYETQSKEILCTNTVLEYISTELNKIIETF